ncbi:MAG: response regulator transcription factor [Thiotrichales bacterium]|jgi:DNA-binding NarL/FixJ family response regulator|nr:response regulator transcription factor [Thiotrichales bacterium]
MKQIRIAIIDDHRIVTQALSGLFNQYKDFKVVGTGYDGKSALELVVNRKPHVLILDLQLPGISGSELLPILKKAYPELHVIVLTATQIKQTWQKVLALGANGIALKSVASEELVEGVRQVMLNKMFIDPAIQAELSQQDSGVYLTLPDHLNHTLTRREREILLLVLNDLTSKQIADKLGISDRTVSKHRENIYHKLGVNSSDDIFPIIQQLSL